MATNIDKSFYEAPKGVELDDDMDEYELDEGLGEGITEDMVTIVELDDGTIEITMNEEDLDPLVEAEFGDNLAEYLDDEVLQGIAEDLVGAIESDEESRKEWQETYTKGLDVLGLKYEERSEPWENACGVYSTVLSEAAMRFQAEAMSETFPASGPVKTKIIGKESRETEDAAKRVTADMNHQITDVMVEYRPEHEKMLYGLSLSGSAFKKVYKDPTLGRQTAMYLPAEDVIVPYGASTVSTAERVTECLKKTESEMHSLMNSGFYKSIELLEPTSIFTDIQKKKAEEEGFDLTEDGKYPLYECHAMLCIKDVDAYEDKHQVAKPYVVTIDRTSGEIVALYRNWVEGDPVYTKRDHFVHYTYVPGFGFYGLGLIHIIGGYARAGTSLIRQLVDAGTLSNLPGGFKTNGMRIKGDNSPVGPGEWVDVDVPSGTIRDNLMALPYKEPSQTLLVLLDRITEEGRRLGAISDLNISDMSANAPVGTTLALLERTLKPMAAVQARVHYAMKQEFKLLKQLVADGAPDDYGYQPATGVESARKQDYEMVEIIPVSDPNSSTMAQRVVQIQAVISMAQQSPQIYNMAYLHRQAIETLGVKNADKIVPVDEDAKPQDPVSENMNVLTGKPIQAFIYQDHQAHIASHMSFMQDPMIAQSIGQNPMAQQIMSALHAHIAEHVAFDYRRQIEEKLGVTMTAPNEELPPAVELELSRVVADAGKQLTQAHQQQAAQQQAQEQAEDPVFKMKQEELANKKMSEETKAAEVARKAKKDADEMEIKRQQEQRKDGQLQIDTTMGAQASDQRAKEFRVKTALDVAKIEQQDKKDIKDTDIKTAQTLISAMSKNPNGRNNGET